MNDIFIVVLLTVIPFKVEQQGYECWPLLNSAKYICFSKAKVESALMKDITNTFDTLASSIETKDKAVRKKDAEDLERMKFFEECGKAAADAVGVPVAGRANTLREAILIYKRDLACRKITKDEYIDLVDGALTVDEMQNRLEKVKKK